MTLKTPCIVMLLIFIGMEVQAQDFQAMRDQVQKQQLATRNEIEELRVLISQFEQQIQETTTRYDQLYRQFENLQREITLRDAMISKLEQENRDLNQQIQITQREYDKLKKELELLIENYKKTITYVYKHGRVPELALILTSASINQMIVRSYYLQKFEDQRRKQAEQIETAQIVLVQKEEELSQNRQQNAANLAETQRERLNMQSRRRQQEQNITRLRNDRRNMQRQLDDTRKSVDNLNRLLAEAIAEEERIQRAEEDRIRELEMERMRRLAEARKIVDDAEREAAVERYSRPVTSASLPSADALASLEASFRSLRGNLRWPVTRGVISQPYGDIVHPVYRTRTPNPGISIATAAASPVVAIHDGYVSFIMLNIIGYDNLVIVSHGNYRTIYGNLSDVQVNQGMFIRTGDRIGLSGTNNSVKGETVFLMVREGQTNHDPALWIQKQQARVP